MDVPGLWEAYESERKTRLLSYVPVSATVSGVLFPQLTLRHYPLLLESPFFVGGIPALEDAVYLAWVLLSKNPFDDAERNLFMESGFIQEIDSQDFINKMSWLVSDAFFDAPTSNPNEPKGKPCLTLIDWMIFRFSADPWRWPLSQIMDTPLRALFQLTKAQTSYNGGVIKNPISDKVVSDFIANLNRKN